MVTMQQRMRHTHLPMLRLSILLPFITYGRTTDEWATADQKNMFRTDRAYYRDAVEAGAARLPYTDLWQLVPSYTASQGLLLMIPNLYTRLPASSSPVYSTFPQELPLHALSISEIIPTFMRCRQTGCAMLWRKQRSRSYGPDSSGTSGCYQGKHSFHQLFDGFRTPHEIQKIETWDYEDLKDMVDMDAVDAFRKRALNPNHPPSPERFCAEP